MLEKLNRRLKEDNVRVRIEERGQSINLRASLPDRNTGIKRQQRIRLDTNDLTEADREARLLDELIRTGGLDVWSLWDARKAEDKLVTFGEFRTAGRRLFEQKGYKNSGTWSKKFQPALNKLPPDNLRCTTELLVAVVQSMEPNTAGRRDQSNTLGQIAESIGLEKDPIQEAGQGYSGAQLRERDIPKDDEIEACFDLLTTPHWRWMYGMCATYGLRPHEIAEARIDEDNNCYIADDTKTGFHIAWACKESWIETFSLKQVCRPPYDRDQVTYAAWCYMRRGRTNRHKGPGRLPFSLYNLRHAYAIRLFHRGVSTGVAARLMGHTEAIHRRVYQRWYDTRDILQLKDRYSL